MDHDTIARLYKLIQDCAGQRNMLASRDWRNNNLGELWDIIDSSVDEQHAWLSNVTGLSFSQLADSFLFYNHSSRV